LERLVLLKVVRVSEAVIGLNWSLLVHLLPELSNFCDLLLCVGTLMWLLETYLVAIYFKFVWGFLEYLLYFNRFQFIDEF